MATTTSAAPVFVVWPTPDQDRGRAPAPGAPSFAPPPTPRAAGANVASSVGGNSRGDAGSGGGGYPFSSPPTYARAPGAFQPYSTSPQQQQQQQQQLPPRLPPQLHLLAHEQQQQHPTTTTRAPMPAQMLQPQQQQLHAYQQERQLNAPPPPQQLGSFALPPHLQRPRAQAYAPAPSSAEFQDLLHVQSLQQQQPPVVRHHPEYRLVNNNNHNGQAQQPQQQQQLVVMPNNNTGGPASSSSHAAGPQPHQSGGSAPPGPQQPPATCLVCLQPTPAMSAARGVHVRALLLCSCVRMLREQGTPAPDVRRKYAKSCRACRYWLELGIKKIENLAKTANVNIQDLLAAQSRYWSARADVANRNALSLAQAEAEALRPVLGLYSPHPEDVRPRSLRKPLIDFVKKNLTVDAILDFHRRFLEIAPNVSLSPPRVTIDEDNKDDADDAGACMVGPGVPPPVLAPPPPPLAATAASQQQPPPPPRALLPAQLFVGAQNTVPPPASSQQDWSQSQQQHQGGYVSPAASNYSTAATVVPPLALVPAAGALPECRPLPERQSPPRVTFDDDDAIDAKPADLTPRDPAFFI